MIINLFDTIYILNVGSTSEGRFTVYAIHFFKA